MSSLKTGCDHPSEWKELIKLANEHQVYLFEAARNYQEAAFQVVKTSSLTRKYWAPTSPLPNILLNCRPFFAGEMPNIFSDVYAGGALMDLGVYCLYLAIGFFGEPIFSHYTAQQLPNSVDLYGQGVLIYPEFQVAIQAGKNITSHLPAEILHQDWNTNSQCCSSHQPGSLRQPFWGSYRPSDPALPAPNARRGGSLCPCHRSSKSQLLILNGYKQLSRSMKPSTICVKALEYNLRMKRMKEQFPQTWKDQLETLGFDAFTEIQEQIFSPIYEGENVLGISPTGTGKTLAYLFPSLLKLKPKKAQQLLILAPNTELAGQIFDVTKQWADPLGLQTQLFLSGSSQKRQIERLKRTRNPGWDAWSDL